MMRYVAYFTVKIKSLSFNLIFVPILSSQVKKSVLINPSTLDVPHSTTLLLSLLSTQEFSETVMTSPLVSTTYVMSVSFVIS